MKKKIIKNIKSFVTIVNPIIIVILFLYFVIANPLHRFIEEHISDVSRIIGNHIDVSVFNISTFLPFTSPLIGFCILLVTLKFILLRIYVVIPNPNRVMKQITAILAALSTFSIMLNLQPIMVPLSHTDQGIVYEVTGFVMLVASISRRLERISKWLTPYFLRLSDLNSKDIPEMVAIVDSTTDLKLIIRTAAVVFILIGLILQFSIFGAFQ